jgi:hypothetical protein
MTAIEHKELKGITLRGIVFTIGSTISIVSAVLGTYYNLKSDFLQTQNQNEITHRVQDIRLKVLEAQVVVLQQDVNELKKKQK